jgi:acyl dehydratase
MRNDAQFRPYNAGFVYAPIPMPSLEIAGLRELRDKVGQEIVVSDWLEISQDRIAQFAEITGDRQWIHVDAERARRESPYHAPVAHGFLTMSMLSRLLNDSLEFANARMGVNYGFNRLRFTGPVPAGSRVRGRFTLVKLEEIEGGVQTTWAVTVEREGIDKPCLVAEWVTRRYE